MPPTLATSTPAGRSIRPQQRPPAPPAQRPPTRRAHESASSQFHPSPPSVQGRAPPGRPLHVPARPNASGQIRSRSGHRRLTSSGPNAVTTELSGSGRSPTAAAAEERARRPRKSRNERRSWTHTNGPTPSTKSATLRATCRPGSGTCRSSSRHGKRLVRCCWSRRTGASGEVESHHRKGAEVFSGPRFATFRCLARLRERRLRDRDEDVG